jgi:hypothetical protein
MNYLKGIKFRNRNRESGKSSEFSKHRLTPMTIAGLFAAAACGGCLYSVIPAASGPSVNYHAPADNQPAQSSQPSQPSTSDQANQNKQQSGTQQNAAQPQPEGGGGTP